MRLRCCKTFCAASWSFQKSGSDACASSFESSSRFAATSKKPPELFDARAQGVGPHAQVPVFAVTQLQRSRHSTSKPLFLKVLPQLLPPERQRERREAQDGAAAANASPNRT